MVATNLNGEIVAMNRVMEQKTKELIQFKQDIRAGRDINFVAIARMNKSVLYHYGYATTPELALARAIRNGKLHGCLADAKFDDPSSVEVRWNIALPNGRLVKIQSEHIGEISGENLASASQIDGQ
jgi:hypothetical protein